VTKPKGYLQINHAWKNKRMKKKTSENWNQKKREMAFS
jgi:hypothetical protein